MSSDMDFDVHVRFNKLYKTGREFKSKLLEAVSTQYTREDFPRWAANLQFLTALPSREGLQAPDEEVHRSNASSTSAHWSGERFLPEALAKAYPSNRGTAVEHRESTKSCCCTSSQTFKTGSSNNPDSRKTLMLTRRGDLQGCTHYLAVSYCWNQPISVSDSYDIITPTGKRRESKVPANVLDRVIAYAASQSIKLIWIDRECIDQDDKEEVELGVDAMDVVYHQAQQVVAVLNAVVETQTHIDAFKIAAKYFKEKSETGIVRYVESELRSIMQVSALISKDPWFSRVWPLQESLMAEQRQASPFPRTLP